MQSPYSPLQLEMKMPERLCWRDAFEDLLALETRGQMICLESRKKEAEVSERILHDKISAAISSMNEQLEVDATYLFTFRKLQHVVAQKFPPEKLEGVIQAIRAQEESSNERIKQMKSRIANYEKRKGNSYPASRYKTRSQWMVSLISSGALPGWGAQIFNTSMGSMVQFSNMNHDPDKINVTDRELNNHFKEGIPLTLQSPQWSTFWGKYPESFKESVSYGYGAFNVVFKLGCPRTSIIKQVIRAECLKSEDGNLSTKVTLNNIFADGSRESEKIVNDPSNVLEENAKVHASMFKWHNEITRLMQKGRVGLIAEQLQSEEDDMIE